jgi:FkbM family methyltransferase
VNEEASSIYAKVGEESQVVSLIRTTDFLKEHNISYIDLMKINIEGGEFDLLDHLIETDFVKNITDIQIQINDFFPNAESLMKKIQQTLKRTHYLTF